MFAQLCQLSRFNRSGSKFQFNFGYIFGFRLALKVNFSQARKSFHPDF